MEFQKIAPSVFKPEKPGDTVEGTLVTVEDGKNMEVKCITYKQPQTIS